MRIPGHWTILGVSKANPCRRLFRTQNVRGGHAATIRRLMRVGPLGVYVIRYRPGHVEEAPL